MLKVADLVVGGTVVGAKVVSGASVLVRDGGVVGDYRMPPYGEDDKHERRAGLSAFLEEMGW